MSTVDERTGEGPGSAGRGARPTDLAAVFDQLPGETLHLDGRSRVPLPTAELCWLVMTGEVHLRPVDRRAPAARRIVAQVLAGGLIGGERGAAAPVALLASGTVGTTVRAVAWSTLDLRGLGLPPWLAPALDGWVLVLAALRAEGVAAGVAREQAVRSGDDRRLDAGERWRVPGPGWVLVRDGGLRADDGRTARSGQVIGCSGATQLHAESDSTVAVLGTDTLVAETEPQVWGDALADLADVAIADLAASPDGAGRRTISRQIAQDDLGDAVTKLAVLFDDRRRAPRSPDPLQACLVELGIDSDELPETDETQDADIDRRLTGLARAGVVRTRPVHLDPGWSTYDNGDLLGFTSVAVDDGLHPVLLRRRRRGYRVFDPGTGSWGPVRAVGGRLAGHGYQIYLPLRAGSRRKRQGGRTAGPIRVRDLIGRGLAGALPDLLVVVLAAAGAALLGMIGPLLIAQIFGRILPNNNQALLAQVAAALVLAAVAIGAFVSTQSFAVERLAQQLQWRWQTWILDRLLQLPATFFREHSPGALSARLLDLDGVRNTVTSVVAGPVLSLLFAGVGVALMFALAPSLALPAVIVVASVAVVSLVLAWRQSQAATMVARIDRAEQSALVAMLTGVAKLRVAQAEDRVFARRLDVALERGRHQVRFESISSVLTVLAAAVPVLATAVLWAVAGSEIGQPVGQRVSAGAYLGFTAAFTTVLGAVFGVVTNARSLVEAVPRVAALRPILAAVPENDRRGADPGEISGLVELNAVSYAYPGGPPVLTDVSFRVEPGEMVAIVGPSGSGKSTLMRLLLGFDQPTGGTVFYDDQDLDGLDITAVRRQLGVVLQNDRLFGGEIARCILGASPLGVEAAWRAAELAGVADDIRAMPMGMHTPLDARGSTISGGQRQRLAIARALVSDPRVLLFDEATSALDNVAQESVTQSLEGLPATRIVIAHRLSTIRRADRVIVLEKGRVVETGTVPELLSVGGTFAAIARRQQL